MTVPKFSIITPSYNQGKYIEKNILSVIEQKYPNVEHWIIDGGSTDNTLEILKKYREYIKWISEPDKGQADAVNKGFRNATGEIIGWINSDDFLLPDSLRTVGEYFTVNNNLMAVVGDLIFVNEVGEYHHTVKACRYTHEYLLNEAKGIIQPSMFFKKELIKKTGGLNINYHYAMDYDFFLKITLNCPIEYIQKPLAAFRMQPKSKTSKGTYHFAKEMLTIRRKYGGKLLSKTGKSIIYLIYTEPFRKVPWIRSVVKKMRSFIKKSE